MFPEYGLYPSGNSRSQQGPFCETIPDPEEKWNPCDDPNCYADTEIQHTLSCLAKTHNVYLMANMGDRIPCDSDTDRDCPTNRQYQYNTNVAYDPQGTLIARYHKYNLFFEFNYDIPPKPEHSYFDTPFGRIGNIVCFDILFEEPTIPLIEEYEIDTMAFPTAWMNVLPYFSAVAFHQAFAIGNGINILGANLHNPLRRFSGSGVYGFNTTVAFRNDQTSMDAKLLVGNLQSKPVKTVHKEIDFANMNPMEPEFQSEVFGDYYNFIKIGGGSGEIFVCHGELCCHLQYTRRPDTNNELFAFGAFRGLHTKEGVYFIEVCALLKCGSSDEASCGEPTVNSSLTYFDNFTLTGNFSTKYVYPMVVTSGEHGVGPSPGQWTYDGHSIFSNGTNEPLVSTIYFSRRYDLDDANITPSPPQKINL